jgi:molybdate transport system ATP-binding protein
MIRVELHKKFKRDEMNFSFELKANRIVIFGPSGCGKTTLLRMLCGVCEPDSGSLYLNDRCLYSSSDSVNVPVYKRNIGYLPQDNNLFPNMSVRDNILYGVRACNLPQNESRFKHLVDKLQIEAKLGEYPASLSGGQKQRVALARTLMINPSLLLLDEPFTALDSPIRNCLRDIVVDFADDENIPLIFVSHNLEDCYSVGKEIVVMDKGRIVEYGNALDILEKPQFYRTAKLFDYRNIWSIERLTEDGLVFLKDGLAISSKHQWDDSYKYLCSRPEKIRLLNDDKELKGDIKNVFNGTIVENHGRGAFRSLIFISNSGHKFELNVSEIYLRKTNLEKGSKAVICLDDESLIFCK